MALPAPRGIFGVHSVSPYNITDGTFYGTLKVVNSATLNVSGTTIPMKGGSAKAPWAVEEGELAAQLDLKVSQYDDFLWTLFMGVTPTENAADPNANVSTLTNKQGTSCQSATTGIASVTVKTGSEGDVKFGKYVVVVKTATTVDVLGSTDADFQRGTAKTFKDGGLSILASNLTITTGAPTDIPGFGITLTGGSGTIGMTVGDTAQFDARPKNSGSMVGVLGKSGASFPEHGNIIMAKKRGTGELCEIDAYRCKGEGFPMGMDENKWAQASIKEQLMYDTARDGFAGVRIVTPLTPN